jgi:hypothetical protein
MEKILKKLFNTEGNVLMKKITFKFNPNKIKTRRLWTINPVTRVVPNKKVYNRQKEKQEARKYLGKWGGTD